MRDAHGDGGGSSAAGVVAVGTITVKQGPKTGRRRASWVAEFTPNLVPGLAMLAAKRGSPTGSSSISVWLASRRQMIFSFRRSGAELSFQVFADRYERRSR